MSQKSTFLAYILWFFFGLIGIHRFYVGHFWWGIIYFFTAGLLGVGWLVDLFLLPSYVRKWNEHGG